MTRIRNQRGHVALLLSLAIVVAASVIGAGVVDVGLADARRIAGELRRQQALATAEDALDRAALWLQLNASRVRSTDPGGWMEPGQERWRICDDTVPGDPCAPQGRGEIEIFDPRWSAYGPLPWLFAPSENGAALASAWYIARAQASGDARPGWSTVHVIAEGRSADDSARARVRRSFRLRPLLIGAPDSPLTTTGTPTIDGAVTIVAPEGVAAESIASERDVLSLVFGPTTPEALQAVAQVHGDCTTLGSASRGFHWIRGACTLSTGGAVGSAAAPVVLVVESGTMQIDGPMEFFGIIVLRPQADGSSTMQQVDGPMALHGALVASGGLRVSADDLALQYDTNVFAPLMQLAGPPSEVPGSWTDHR